MSIRRILHCHSSSRSILTSASPVAATSSSCQPRCYTTEIYNTAHRPSRRSSACHLSRHFHTSRPSFRDADPYQILGVSKTATKDEIKKQYFKMAKQYHPDLRPGDKAAATKFSEIGNAYEILSDDEKRKMYDTYGTADPQQAYGGGGGSSGFPGGAGGGAFPGFSGFGGFGKQSAGGGGGGFEDIFGSIFGQQTGMRSPTRGADLTATATIAFTEAVNGTKRELRLTRNATCMTCSGSGHKPGASASATCSKCGGSGQTIDRRGIFAMQNTCQQCGGTGRAAPSCDNCGGSGLVKETTTITVNIPAGVNDDTTLRLANQGDAGTLGGPRGHLFVKLSISSDSRFRREGADIYVDASISPTTAMLGGHVNVPTLTGEARVKVDAGIQPGEKRRLRGKGMRVLNSTATGDQYVVFNIVIPKHLTPAQKAAAEQLHVAMGEKPHAAEHSSGGSSDGSSGAGKDGENAGFGSWFNRK